MNQITTSKWLSLSATGVLSVALLFSSCKKDEPTNTDDDTNKFSYTVPTTYNYSNVKHDDEVTLINMFVELETEMKKGATGTVLSSSKLQDMFANVNSPFVSSLLNAASVDIKSSSILSARLDIEAYLDSLASYSNSVSPASNGVAGIGVSTVDATKKYLLSPKGFNYQQFVSKTLMGALITHQITELLSASADNTTVVSEEGTEMEHNWDRAFGIFYAPIDFPTTLTGLKYWSSYCNQVNTIGSNKIVMDAFLKGRVAISNGDIATKNIQAAIIIEEFEKMTAAAAIHELQEAREDLTNTPKVNTNVSESIAFLLSLKYNTHKTHITNAQIDTIVALYGDNLYELTTDKLNSVVSAISAIYGWDSIKDAI